VREAVPLASAIGLTGLFGVIDAGEGSGAASDTLSQVFSFRPGTLTCRDIGPEEVSPSPFPSRAGTSGSTEVA
jgi:hypothetical protein